jgi:hypothetical protein
MNAIISFFQPFLTKSNFMYFKRYYIFISILSIALTSCKKEKFETNNSEFQNVYNNLVDSGNESDITWDAEVHSYNFTLSENRSITSIGYQSHQDLAGTDYLIEIINNIDSSIVYNGGHQFSSTELSYVSPNNTISLQSGVPYTLNRIQTNWGQYITETIGHIIKTEQADYPLTFGVLTISETNFYDYGSESPWSKYQALPRIDIVLE